MIVECLSPRQSRHNCPPCGSVTNLFAKGISFLYYSTSTSSAATSALPQIYTLSVHICGVYSFLKCIYYIQHTILISYSTLSVVGWKQSNSGSLLKKSLQRHNKNNFNHNIKNDSTKLRTKLHTKKYIYNSTLDNVCEGKLGKGKAQRNRRNTVETRQFQYPQTSKENCWYG